MKLLILGASGSAGGCVLQVCLASPDVTEVRAIVRRRLAIADPTLREIIHSNYQDFTAIADEFSGVDACLYCLGKSARQVSGEAEYRIITYDYALAAARTLRAQSPAAGFHFISGAGAHLSSRFMWARVKAETERDLIAQFNAVCYRPSAIDGMPSASEPRVYKFFRPVGRALLKPFRSLYVTGKDIGVAMLRAGADGVRGRVIENAEIRDTADRARRA